MEKISHFIDGKIYSVPSSRTGSVFNPAIGQQIAEVELASKDTVKLAVNSASKAYLKWSKTTPISRSRILEKYKSLVVKNMDELAELATSVGGVETGIALPVTGDRYEAIFVQFAASMQELQDLDEKLFASEDYLAMFAKASQYMESRFDSVFAQRII